MSRRMRRGAVLREGEELLGLVVELGAALDQLEVGPDRAQRLGEVVRGDVGELLELAVGALEVAGAIGELQAQQSPRPAS